MLFPLEMVKQHFVGKCNLFEKNAKEENHTSGAKLFTCPAVGIDLLTRMLLTYYVIKKSLILGSSD